MNWCAVVWLARWPRFCTLCVSVVLCASWIGDGFATATANSSGRVLRLRGHEGSVAFSAFARLTSSTRWCVRLDLAQGTPDGPPGQRLYRGRPACGSIARQSATAVTFGCPYGVGIAAMFSGNVDAVIRDRNGHRLRVFQRSAHDVSAAGIFFAAFVRRAQLPAVILKRSRGHERKMADLKALDEHC
jgi:hypothetical protein